MSDYYNLRISFPREKYEYIINELENMTGRERNALVKDLLCDFFKRKLFQEENDTKMNEKESIKASDSSVVAVIAQVTKQMEEMQRKQDKMTAQYEKMLSEIANRKTASESNIVPQQANTVPVQNNSAQTTMEDVEDTDILSDDVLNAIKSMGLNNL